MILWKTPLNACECKFFRYCINQNTTLNFLLRARIKSTLLTLQIATPRVHFASPEGLKSAWQKCNRQKFDSDKSMTDKSTTKSRSKGIQHASISDDLWCHCLKTGLFILLKKLMINVKTLNSLEGPNICSSIFFQNHEIMLTLKFCIIRFMGPVRSIVNFSTCIISL